MKCRHPVQDQCLAMEKSELIADAPDCRTRLENILEEQDSNTERLSSLPTRPCHPWTWRTCEARMVRIVRQFSAPVHYGQITLLTMPCNSPQWQTASLQSCAFISFIHTKTGPPSTDFCYGPLRLLTVLLMCRADYLSSGILQIKPPQ